LIPLKTRSASNTDAAKAFLINQPTKPSDLNFAERWSLVYL